ncbi:hypothetical protein GmHk_20G057469 [Glycine max]|nr:hypothetical protein GmHk_20G057469 [Glycine max]
MEFAYRDGQNQRTPLPTLCPISTPAYVSEHPLQGFDFMPSGFSNNVLVPRVFPTLMSVNADETFQRDLETKHIQQEPDKEEIIREILVNKMTLTQRQELDEEANGDEESIGTSMQNWRGYHFGEFQCL